MALALWGESLLWIQHGASKDNDLDANLHYSLGGIAGWTAVCLPDCEHTTGSREIPASPKHKQTTGDDDDANANNDDLVSLVY